MIGGSLNCGLGGGLGGAGGTYSAGVCGVGVRYCCGTKGVGEYGSGVGLGVFGICTTTSGEPGDGTSSGGDETTGGR